MNAIVIYHTNFGNTEKIAKALANGIKEQGVTVDCCRVEDVDASKPNKYDLLSFGAPTHMFGISKPMKNLLNTLKQAGLEGKKAFAFDTKYKGRFTGSAGKGIEKKLKQLNMEIVKSYTSGIVKGNRGPLQEGMEETFKQVGVDLAKS